jgi:Lon protease-like protein
MDDRTFDQVGDGDRLTTALDALPVFPLPGVVLFPGALLPLHIFEPRYQAMLADCLATHRCMALVFAFAPGERTSGEATIARISGAGSIVHHAPLADGRSNIVLRGLARVVTEELPFVAPYRRVRARVLREVGSAVSEVDRVGLHAAATAFAAAARETEFALPSGLAPGAAADLCAHHLIVDPSERQRVLEELDVAARVRRVTAAMAEQMGRKRRRSTRPD